MVSIKSTTNSDFSEKIQNQQTDASLFVLRLLGLSA